MVTQTQMASTEMLQAQILYLKQQLQTTQKQNSTLKQLISNLLNRQESSKEWELIVQTLLADINRLSAHQLHMSSATKSTLDGLCGT